MSEDTPVADRDHVSALTRSLEALGRATPAQFELRRAEFFELAVSRLSDPAGLAALHAVSDKFESAGVFAGGPWAQAERLLPRLVRGSLLSDALTAEVETMSELRMLAIAEGRQTNPEMSAQDARSFLREVVIHNLDTLSGASSEESRNKADEFARARLLITHIMQHLSPDTVRRALVEEIEQLCAQRSVDTRRTERLIEQALALPGPVSASDVAERLERFRRATTFPTPRAEAAQTVAAYRTLLPALSLDELTNEAVAMGELLGETGLSNPYHALLLRHVSEFHPSLISAALKLDEMGEASVYKFGDQLAQLIDIAIHPDTSFAIAGLAAVLERGLLGRRAVAGGLRRVEDLRLAAEAKRALMDGKPPSAALSPTSLLVAGALAVLGHPFGVAQGNNPTCQSARAISMWAQTVPGYLLNLLAAAARDGRVRMYFEGMPLSSDQLTGGVAAVHHPDVDPVSRVLVPHLDRLYDEMMRLAAPRLGDAHRWVNPAFYGRWVPEEFACVLDIAGKRVIDYDNFVRRFYATHHPTFNENDEMVYPNPVGILVTDVHGRLLGMHAVSLLRVELDPTGEVRAYFFNPNHEGRQDWGYGARTSVSGHGEVPGESSLPFAQFASRLYAFHYHPYEGGEIESVPDATVVPVREMAQATWGRTFGGFPTAAVGQTG